MTAQPTGHVAWSPDLTKQRSSSYTLEDVLQLPDDAPRVELRDGAALTLRKPFDIELRVRDITP